jgi:catechol 2,3-dioxygenase-like lactoylglutathione lyase family enzyme
MIRGGQVTLFVRDVATSVRFWIETLGMKLVEEEAGYAVVDAGNGFRVALHAGGAATPAKGSPKVGLYPKMPIEEAIAILENRGVKFEIVRDARVTLATFRDPDGNTLYLRQAT